MDQALRALGKGMCRYRYDRKTKTDRTENSHTIRQKQAKAAIRYRSIFSTFADDPEPYSKLHYKSSEEQIYSWIIDTMELKEQREYYYYCGLWSKIKLLDLKCAVAALWRSEKNVSGFLLAETDLSRVMECGLDSRDEYHFLIDIWTFGHGVCL